MRTARVMQLALVAAGGEPPSEFQIFSAGKVETTKGDFIFDAASAASVMKEYKAHGIDLMVDYDHASLASLSLDPAQAGKAAGWFGLEVRNGALWAVNVRWTLVAAAALSAKEWRFMSPAFTADDGHITTLLNVAITNIPATRRLDPLMAASSGGDSAMTVEEFLAVLKALKIDPSTSLADALAKIQGGADTGDDAPPSSADGGPPSSSVDAPIVPPADGDAPPPSEKKDAVAASAVRLMRLTGAKSFVEAVETVETYRTSHIELETERTKLAAERATLEGAERRKLCVELVEIRAEFPATVWADDKSTTLKSRWLKMDIGELRSHVAEQRKARGGKPKNVRSPAGTASNDAPSEVVGLTAAELKICQETKCDPANFLSLKKIRDAGTTGGT